jgi:nucleoside-diphosphate-sugar epimerase
MNNSKHHKPLPLSDLEEIIELLEPLLSAHANSSILITGGTGFVGNWILSTLVKANLELNLQLEISVLTRKGILRGGKTTKFVKEHLHDLRFPLPASIGRFDFVIHAATPTHTSTGASIAGLQKSIIEEGTKNLLNFLRKFSPGTRILHTSSGAVYGTSNHIIPEFSLNPTSKLSSYGKSKLLAEKMIVQAEFEGYISGCNARLFAFAGPGIPLNEHFAVGNFISAAINNMNINVKGNRYTKRSYLYPTDLTRWALTSLFLDKVKLIHISNNLEITMEELAGKVQQLSEVSKVSFNGDWDIPSVYIGENTTSKELLSERVTVEIDEMLNRWEKWLKHD